MFEKADEGAEQTFNTVKDKVETIASEIENCKLQSAANHMIGISRIGNQYLNEKEPWKLIKENRQKAANIFNLTAQITKVLAIVSAPFIPFAAEEIWKTLNLPRTVHEQDWNEALRPLTPGGRICKPKPLFKKIDANVEELAARLEDIRANLDRTA